MRLRYVKILGDGGLWSESFSKSNRTSVVIVGNVEAIPKLGFRRTMGLPFIMQLTWGSLVTLLSV